MDSALYIGAGGGAGLWCVVDWASADADYSVYSAYVPYVCAVVGHDVRIAESAGEYWAEDCAD